MRPKVHPQGSGRAAGMTRTVAYDDAGRIAAYTHTGPTGAALPAFDQTFAYDGLDRLRMQQQLATAYAWDHDLGGNRTSQTLGGTPYTHTVDTASNRLTTQSTPAGTTTLGYDAAGNLATDATRRATYSDRGRLASLTLGADTVAYRYNALEQRVLKSGPTHRVPGGVRYYVYDEQGHLIGEYDQAANPVFEVVYLNDTPVAVITQTRSGSGTTLNVQTQVADVYSDHLDTPRVITRHTDQAVLWRWDQAEAFGNSPPNENPTGLGVFSFPGRFPGQVFDVESGLVYNHHRQYDPALGRYTQSDPIGLNGGYSTYAYSLNAPTIYIDADGLNPYVAIRVLVAVGAKAIDACRRNPRCRKGVEEIKDDCENLECKLTRERADHRKGFPGNQFCEHYRLTCWIKGKGQVFADQWPLPGRCFPHKQTELGAGK